MSESKLRTYLETLLPQPGRLVAEQIIQESSMNPQQVRKTAHVQKLAELSRQNCRIVGVEQLEDNALLRADCEKGARLWVITPGKDTQIALERYPKACRDLGGGIIGLFPPNLLRSKLDQEPEVAAEFTNMDTVRVPQDIVDRFADAGVETRRASWMSRLLKNPKTLVYLVVFIYSSLRALPVVFVKEFEGSILLLWTIDVVTAIPYTWGVLAMVLGSKPLIRVAGALTTVVTFMAPYIYFWMKGTAYPWYVTVIVGFLIFTGVAIEIAKYVQEKTLERKYSSVLAGKRRAPKPHPKKPHT